MAGDSQMRFGTVRPGRLSSVCALAWPLLRSAALLVLIGLVAAAPLAKQITFPTPDAAISAMVEAVQAGDTARMLAIFGPGSESLIRSGDPVSDANSRHTFLDAYNAKHALEAQGEDKMVLHVGTNDWPLPIPLVRQNGAWHFDSRQGADEIVNRRIGRNEIAAIRTALAYVDAQREYFELFKQARGQGEYAQRMLSTPGNYDGLYWPPAEGIPPSPLSEFVSDTQEEGYPGEFVAGRQYPYHGYLFRILKEQGPSAPGGAHSYVVNGHMTGGFALIAWPATYGASGIMTFIVNQDGVVFQKDLGPDTTARVATFTRYDPDLSWARVDITAAPAGSQ